MFWGYGAFVLGCDLDTVFVLVGLLIVVVGLGFVLLSGGFGSGLFVDLFCFLGLVFIGSV